MKDFVNGNVFTPKLCALSIRHKKLISQLLFMTQVYSQLSHLRRLCNEALTLTNADRDDEAFDDPEATKGDDAGSDANETVGLITQPAEVRKDDPSVVYALGLLKQLQAGVRCSRTELRRRVRCAVNQTEKIQEIVRNL